MRINPIDVSLDSLERVQIRRAIDVALADHRRKLRTVKRPSVINDRENAIAHLEDLKTKFERLPL